MHIPRLTRRALAWRSALLAILLWLVAWTSSQALVTPLRLAASGELGSSGPNGAKAANLVNRWNPDFIHTVNDSDPLTTTTPASAMDAGYQDFRFHPDCTSTPTGEKPESKLWFTDGTWWASMCTSALPAYHIYRLDRTTNAWIDTGTVLDDRGASKADVLWEEATQTLYVASHIFTTLAEPTPAEDLWGRLYRYRYNAADQTYVLDPGFPVAITHGKSETLTLAKDTTGKLWVTYVESSQVMVNHSSGSGLEFDHSWGAPYPLPVSSAAALSSDDIATLVAYAGRIGIMWSNQNTRRLYFAGHQDSEIDDQTWQVASVYNPGGLAADDHLNLKSLQRDGTGHLYAVTKTNYTEASQPLVVLLACQTLPCLTAKIGRPIPFSPWPKITRVPCCSSTPTTKSCTSLRPTRARAVASSIKVPRWPTSSSRRVRAAPLSNGQPMRRSTMLRRPNKTSTAAPGWSCWPPATRAERTITIVSR